MFTFFACLPGLLLASPGPSKAEDGDRRAFVIKDLHLENGTILPAARIMYTTFGKLNAARPAHSGKDTSLLGSG